ISVKPFLMISGQDDHPSSLLLYFFHFGPSNFYTLSLLDALPICGRPPTARINLIGMWSWRAGRESRPCPPRELLIGSAICCRGRSEEHTSELQSRFELVCRLLLEKEKTKINEN